eukprot:8455753-Pyramimonas_sp.AAC.2
MLLKLRESRELSRSTGLDSNELAAVIYDQIRLHFPKQPIYNVCRLLAQPYYSMQEVCEPKSGRSVSTKLCSPQGVEHFGNSVFA